MSPHDTGDGADVFLVDIIQIPGIHFLRGDGREQTGHQK